MGILVWYLYLKGEESLLRGQIHKTYIKLAVGVEGIVVVRQMNMFDWMRREP